MDRVVSLPRHLSRTRNRWALGDLLESDERVPVRRFLRSHRPPPPRENRTRASSLADRHPRASVFPIALVVSPKAEREFWKPPRKRVPGPDQRYRIGSIPLRQSKSRKPGALAVREIDPASPDQPAGRC